MLLPPLYPPKPIRAWAGSDLHTRLLNDPNWVVQPKANGDRVLVFFLQDEVQLWNRHGKQTRYTWLGQLRAELKAWNLSVGTILDAELLHEPKPSQDMMVFDMPSCPGTFVERYRALTECFMEGTHLHLAPLMNKATAYEDALAAGHEGVVWKKLDSAYVWQRGNTGCEVPYWIKMKPASTFD